MLKVLLKYLKEFRFRHLYSQIRGAFENYRRANSNLWANTLCYFTLLSFIPILAIIYSIGVWFGIGQHYLQELSRSSPLNEETINLLLATANNLLESTKNGWIAGAGAISLIWVAIKMFTTIEKALNSIWGIEKPRPFFRRFSDYLLIFLTFPLCMICANIFKMLKNLIDFYDIPYIIELVVPYIVLWLFFLVFYNVMPNTKVEFVPTVLSSFVVSFLLNQSNMILINLQSFINQYNKIYGSFSVLLLSLMWLKLVWFLILMGAHFSYIVQNRASLVNLSKAKRINFNTKFAIYKRVIVEFVRNYISEENVLTLKEISNRTRIPIELIYDATEGLIKMNYIAYMCDENGNRRGMKLIKNVENITYETLLEDMKASGENIVVEELRINSDKKIVEYLRGMLLTDK